MTELRTDGTKVLHLADGPATGEERRVLEELIAAEVEAETALAVARAKRTSYELALSQRKGES